MKFTNEETLKMATTFKKQFIANGLVTHVMKRKSAKNSFCYEIRYRSNRFCISAAANGVAADETVETWWDGFYEKFASVYSDCGEPESTDVTLGGTDGEKYTFSGTLNGQEYKYIIAACVRGGYVYYLTYTSTPDYYENHLDEFDKTVENFSFR